MSESEKELAGYLTEELFGDKPRSVGEALEAADEVPDETPGEPEVEQPIEVEDEPAPGPPPAQPEVPAELEVEPEPEAEPEPDDPNVVWAQKKYGEVFPPKAARALWEQEQMISRQAAKVKENEQLATEWYEYAQQAERQTQVAMPLSAQEEQWADQAMADPVRYGIQAAMSGNMQLYNAVIERVAYQDPRRAAAVETEVRLALMGAAEQESENGGQQSLQATLAGAIQRSGIDLQTYGQAMSEKIGELGEYHPYVQAILEGDDSARDIALMAVLDMVRSSSFSTQKVRDSARDDAIRREAQLRKEASGVVTGGGKPNPPKKEDPFMEAMTNEWRQRGQWSDE